MEDTPNEVEIVDEELNEEVTQGPVVNHSVLLSAIKTAREGVKILEDAWLSLRDEFQINEDMMKQVVEYNTAARLPKTEEATDETYDEFNGLDLIPDDKINEIFGKECNIYGLTRSQTIDRIKIAVDAFYSLFLAHRDLKEIEKDLSDYREMQEAESIRVLKEIAETHPEEEKRINAQKTLDNYNSMKYLEFIHKDISKNTISYIIGAFNNQPKIAYMFERARGYLKKINIPEKFILEITSFEKRFLTEEYHQQNNLLLLYFLNLIVYNKILSDKTMKQIVISFVLGMDKLIRGLWNEEDKIIIMENIIKFEDIFLDLI